MSEQPPLASPSGPSGPEPVVEPVVEPVFEPYDAPAWGAVRREPPVDPTLVVPQAPPPPPAPPGVSGQPTYGQPYQVAPQYLAHASAPTHPLATASLVLGVIGVVGTVLTPFFYVTFLAAVCSPFAIWLAVRSRREIRREPHRYSGDGIATAGLVTGIVGLVLGLIALVLVLLLIAFIAALFSG